ncbi:MAG TPA: substrate-binding domain-containing protein [Gemmatimonadales bacterium]|nr:substrate-binding domain-containing protein [Gemmatimonadales bacterium]
MTKRTLGVLTLALLLASCGKKKHDRPQVGVTLLTEAHVFYQNLKQGLQQGADSLGVDLHVVAGEWDLARQTSQVQNFVTQGMDAIVVAPVNSSGIVSAIEDANHAHIPVFTADISADGGQVVAHVASDNIQGGRLLGEYVATRLKGGGNVAILDQPTVASVRDRVTGFTDALSQYPNIRIVARPAVERGLRDVAKQKMDNLLTTDQHIDAVFGTNDDCALGALAAIQAAGTKNIFVVGYDATPEARTEIASGTALVADAVQDPVTIGRRTIETVVQALKGQSVPSIIPVPVGLVTRDSLRALH